MAIAEYKDRSILSFLYHSINLAILFAIIKKKNFTVYYIERVSRLVIFIYKNLYMFFE